MLKEAEDLVFLVEDGVDTQSAGYTKENDNQ
jgi:hypothetical protein